MNDEIEMEASVTLPLDELAEKLRPPHVPDYAKVAQYASIAIEGGTQRDPYLSGVKIVWRWNVMPVPPAGGGS